MMAYHLSLAAKQHLLTIRAFSVEHWGIEQADNYLFGIRKQLQLLAKTPQMGIRCNNMAAESFYFPYKSHVIYYIISDERLVIAAILHQRQAPQAHLIRL